MLILGNGTMALATKKLMDTAIAYWLSGYGYRDIERILRQQGHRVSYATIGVWCTRYQAVTGQRPLTRRSLKGDAKKKCRELAYQMRREGLSYRVIEYRLKEMGHDGCDYSTISKWCKDDGVYPDGCQVALEMYRAGKSKTEIRDYLRENGYGAFNVTTISQWIEDHGVTLPDS